MLVLQELDAACDEDFTWLQAGFHEARLHRVTRPVSTSRRAIV